MKQTVGRRIRELRKAHRPPWSINHLALEAQIDPAQLSRAERGLAGLSLNVMGRVAGLLGVSLGELVDPERCGGCHLGDSQDSLVHFVTEHIWQGLDDDKLEHCSTAEQALIRHQIRSVIEEGIKRGQIHAEREIDNIVRRER